MAVKVNDADRTIGTVDRSQQRKSNGMVTAKSDDPGERLPILCRTKLVSIRGWGTGKEVVVALLDLAQCPSIIISARRW